MQFSGFRLATYTTLALSLLALAVSAAMWWRLGLSQEAHTLMRRPWLWLTLGLATQAGFALANLVLLHRYPPGQPYPRSFAWLHSVLLALNLLVLAWMLYSVGQTLVYASVSDLRPSVRRTMNSAAALIVGYAVLNVWSVSGAIDHRHRVRVTEIRRWRQVLRQMGDSEAQGKDV